MLTLMRQPVDASRVRTFHEPSRDPRSVRVRLPSLEPLSAHRRRRAGAPHRGALRGAGDGVSEADPLDLPGRDGVLQGLQALAEVVVSEATLWLRMASSRLGANGILVPAGPPDVHLHLFRHCVAADPAMGHATYRALNEELASFLDTREARRRVPASPDGSSAAG